MSLLSWFSRSPESIHWDAGMDRLPRVTIDGDHVQIRNVRNFQYGCYGQYDPRYETRDYSLSAVVSLDFIVVPFSFARGLAHTMTSFAFSDGTCLTISVEARRQHGEAYSMIKGLFFSYPLMYIIADERDAIGVRSVCRCDDVYVFRSAASPESAQRMFKAMLMRAEALAVKPQRYHTLLNNCLTNIRAHVNRIWPRRIPYGWRVLFSGHAAYLAHELGLLAPGDSFESVYEEAQISDLARKHIHAPDFSRLIRQR